jgi:creatinine amidohydrolase
MPINRYEDLHPAEFDAAFKRMPVCYVPVGSIEWHGEHLPLGVDCFRPRMILERASEIYGGIVYPPVYTGIPGEVRWDPKYGYDANLMITEPVFRPLITAIVARLKQTGFKGIFLITGHHPNTQPAVLREIAQQMSDDRCRVWGNADPALGGIYKGDHAGYGETSFMMYGRPELVKMDRLAPKDNHGVSKEADGSPQALRSSAQTGKEMIESAVEKMGEILRTWGLLK